MSDLITKMVPILHVEDPDAERRFYEQLGLRTTYDGPEYPGFIAVGNDAVEVAVERPHEDWTYRIASPALGPSRSVTATARLSATTGLAVIDPSKS